MGKTMLQQVMTAPGEISFREIEIPVVKPGEVLVRMDKIGVCGSDIHVYHGTHPFTSYPVTQGHEASGEIAELGEGVSGLTVGDKVTIEPQVVCGRCYPCRHGKYNLCEELKVMGFQTTGMASQYFAVDAEKVMKLPDTMTFEEGAMIEPLAVGVHAVRRIKNIEGMRVAVEGAGPIGILLAQAAKALGASGVLITDVSDYRLAKAEECGIDYICNADESNLGEAMTAAFGPDKADVIFDCAGNDITMGQAIKYARKGSMIILVAVYEGKANVDLAVLNDHELDLNTTMMYRHEDYLEAIRIVKEGRVKLEPLMSRTFRFTDYKKAYEYIDSNRETSMKILIDVTQM